MKNKKPRETELVWMDYIHSEIPILINRASLVLAESIAHERGQVGMGNDWECGEIIERLNILDKHSPDCGTHLVWPIIKQC